jgi:hypothetical protein
MIADRDPPYELRRPLEVGMRLPSRALVVVAAAFFCGILSLIISLVVGFVGAYLRRGSVEMVGGDMFVEWALLVSGICSCAVVYWVWKRTDQDRFESN